MKHVGTLVVMLAACTSNPTDTAITQLQTMTPSITKVTVVATTSISVNQPPPLNLTITDATTAQAVYETTLGLPDFPQGAFACPADFGVSYTLTFFSGDDAIVTANADPNGCTGVVITGPSESDTLQADAAYWTTLASELGITGTRFPYSPS